MIEEDGENPQIKLIDFGLAHYLNADEGMNRIVGSMLYMAPEILINNRPYNEKCDLWSAGIVFYIMLTGCIPYTEREKEELKKFIIAGQYDK